MSYLIYQILFQIIDGLIDFEENKSNSQQHQVPEQLQEHWWPSTLHPKYSVDHYNVVNFPQYPHNRHPIACPWGRGMGCLLWF